MSDNEKQWFVDIRNEIVGPVSLDVLRDWLRVKTITSETWVRQNGSSEWQPLAMVEELDMTTEGTQDLQKTGDRPSPYIQSNDLEMDEPQPTDRDRLLNRAFEMKCIAIMILLLGVLFIVPGMFSMVINQYHHPIFALFVGFLSFIPVLLCYYAFNSISIALKSSAQLCEKVEQLQKMLENDKKRQPRNQG